MSKFEITLGMILAVVAFLSGFFTLTGLTHLDEIFNGKHSLGLIEMICGGSYLLFGDVCLTCWRNRE